MGVYRKLQEKLNSTPVGVPDRPELFEILRILFTTEEAELSLHLSFSPKPIVDIAKKAGLSVDDATELCERLADKGLVLTFIHQGNKNYRLSAIMPGLFEYPLAKRGQLDLDFDRLIELWQQYLDDALLPEMHASKINSARILPVQKTIEANPNVLPFDELSHYIDQAESISLMECACRITQKRCNNPIETCIAFDSVARFLVERNFGRLITKEEAFKIINECEKAGLVHITTNTSDKIMFLCNCCSCCCMGVGGATRLKKAASHPVSSFFASVHVEDCNACGICEETCPSKAVALDDVATIDNCLCIGCGLCASACPKDAIELIRRPDAKKPFLNFKELSFKQAEERGRMDAFLANLK